MDGRKLDSGAVSSVKNIPNPVSLARAVMEKVLPHHQSDTTWSKRAFDATEYSRLPICCWPAEAPTCLQRASAWPPSPLRRWWLQKRGKSGRNTGASKQKWGKISTLGGKNWSEETKYSPSLHNKVGLMVIKNTRNCDVLWFFLSPPCRAHDTVGAVAVDSAGNVACATSTGGIRNKMVGRVGDSPVIGATAQFHNHY